jgi:hypothetical protein
MKTFSEFINEAKESFSDSKKASEWNNDWLIRDGIKFIKVHKHENADELRKLGIITLAEGTTLEDIKKVAPWFFKARVTGAQLQVDKGKLIFWGGTWYNGIWEGGIWEGGTFNEGVWKKGLWKWGQFGWKGDITKCIWEDGIWEDGLFAGGMWEDGVWENGTLVSGIFNGGVWKDGIFDGGHDDYMGMGTFYGGQFNGGQFKSGLFYGGEWNGGKWNTRKALWVNGEENSKIKNKKEYSEEDADDWMLNSYRGLKNYKLVHNNK